MDTGRRGTRWWLLPLLLAVGLSAPVQARDPTNMAECQQMTRGPLEQECNRLFADPARASERAACLERIGPELESVCEQFFGEGRDFCATCTSSCTGSFESGSARRRECLAMCMQQPGCR